jgi:3'-5' exonuclease
MTTFPSEAKTMNEFYFDIETVKTTDQQWVNDLRNRLAADALTEVSNLRAPGNIKDPVKIDAWHQTEYPVKVRAIQESAAAEVNDQWGKTVFDGALGHIAVIGFAIGDEAPVAIFKDSKDPASYEAEILREFFYAIKHLKAPKFVGHNIINFDLRFLFQRAVVLGVQPPACIPFAPKPWDDNVFDTMIRWAGVGNRVSMDKLAHALGLPGKQGIDGSMVGDLIADGEIAKVADYCANTDVAQVRQIYQRMTFQNTNQPIAA